METSAHTNSLTAHDAASIGSRLAAILIGGRLLSELPQVPLDMALLRYSDSLNGNAFMKLMESANNGRIMHIVLVPLLAVACLILWYKSEFVARTIVNGIGSDANTGRTDRNLVSGFVTAAGWIIIMYSLEAVARTISLFATSEAPQPIAQNLGGVLVLVLGVILIVTRSKQK